MRFFGTYAVLLLAALLLQITYKSAIIQMLYILDIQWF